MAATLPGHLFTDRRWSEPGRILTGATALLSAVVLIQLLSGIGRDGPETDGPELAAVAPVAAVDFTRFEPGAGQQDDQEPDGGIPERSAENVSSSHDATDALPEPDRGLLEPRGRELEVTTIEGLEDVAADLSRRRDAIERREAELAIREQALKKTIARISSDLDRLETLHSEIIALTTKVDAEEEERMRQLVKVYETMKAKEAAEIFDRLEPGVLLDVTSRMREAKLASILAKMEPGRARFLTIELARKLDIPDSARH